MSGHSKWSTIKRHKAAVDAKRGKMFSLIGKEITLAAKAGGGNPEFNPQLRTLMLKAKAANIRPQGNSRNRIRRNTSKTQTAPQRQAFLINMYTKKPLQIVTVFHYRGD